jgi:hypothetical protein
MAAAQKKEKHWQQQRQQGISQGADDPEQTGAAPTGGAEQRRGRRPDRRREVEERGAAPTGGAKQRTTGAPTGGAKKTTTDWTDDAEDGLNGRANGLGREGRTGSGQGRRRREGTVELWPAAEEEAADGGESHGSVTMLGKNDQMLVAPVLGLHI